MKHSVSNKRRKLCHLGVMYHPATILLAFTYCHDDHIYDELLGEEDNLNVSSKSKIVFTSNPSPRSYLSNYNNHHYSLKENSKKRNVRNDDYPSSMTVTNKQNDSQQQQQQQQQSIDKSSMTKGVVYHKKIRIKHLTAQSHPETVAELLIKKYSTYFSSPQLPQLCRLISKIINKIGSYNYCKNGHNNITNSDRNEKKEKQSTFMLDDKNNQQLERSDCEILKTKDIDDNIVEKGKVDDTLYDLKKKISDIGDLNKVPDEHVIQAKAEMDKFFAHTRVKPGDDGYIYDKRVDFSETDVLDSSWD